MKLTFRRQHVCAAGEKTALQSRRKAEKLKPALAPLSFNSLLIIMFTGACFA